MNSPQPQQAPKRRSALKLFLILLIFLAPMIGALFMYQQRESLEFITKNHGTLVIPPVSLESLGVETPKPGRWLLAYYTPNACDKECLAVMAHFSVIELSLIKDKPRLGSIILSPHPIHVHTLPKEPDDLLAKQTNDLPLPDQLLPWTARSGIWLIDPLGNVILRYEPDALDNLLLLDLRYLMKVSQIG